MTKPAWIKELHHIVGPDRVYDEAVDCFGYAYDSSPEPLERQWTPEAVVRAQTTEEVAQVMRLAYREGIPVTPRGIGSGRSGGSVPICGGIVLSLEGMNRILEIDHANMMVTCEPGVRTKDLYDACAAEGLFYPPDPSSHVYSTIGGNIAENAGGMRAVKYGVTAPYVMALEVVLPDGRIIEVGGKMVKNVTGYNLVPLFVGSEGTLGIITKATLRLLALPKAKGTARAGFATIQAAGAAVAEALEAGLTPAAAEIMDEVAIRAAERFLDFTPPEGARALILFDVDGNSDADISAQLDALEAICQGHDLRLWERARDQAEADALWTVRRKLSSAVAAMAPDKIGEDVSVPRAQLPAMVERLTEIAERHGLLMAIYGHAGDGNLHPAFLCDMAKADDRARLERAVSETFQAAVELGGTLSGEHGIGISKQPWIREALSDEVIALSKSLKAAFDPKGILNPGKIF